MKFLLVALVYVAILLQGCGRAYVTESLPSLPPRTWDNNESSEQPKVNSVQWDTLPSSFLDCVYYAMQNSPALNASAIQIEARKIAHTDTEWKFLPEVHLQYTISNNLTRYNQGKNEAVKGKDYGNTAYQLRYTAFFNNPVQTWFELGASEKMTELALLTHQKAVSNCIQSIAELFVLIDGKEREIKLKECNINEFSNLTNKASIESKYTESGELSKELAADKAAWNVLDLEHAKNERVVLLGRLKSLLGIPPLLKTEIDAASVYPFINRFQGKNLNWQAQWETTREFRMQKLQIMLERYGIFLAWAKYAPTMSFTINENPPNGQAQSVQAKTDQFLHFTFDFPLIDWGRKYREAEIARLRVLEQLRNQQTKRLNYEREWMECEQEDNLAALNSLKAKQSELIAQKQLQVAMIRYRTSSAGYSTIADAKAELLQQRIGCINAERRSTLSKLRWMSLASVMDSMFVKENSSETK